VIEPVPDGAPIDRDEEVFVRLTPWNCPAGPISGAPSTGAVPRPDRSPSTGRAPCDPRLTSPTPSDRLQPHGGS